MRSIARMQGASRRFSSSVKIGVLKEGAAEQRVAMVPAVAQKLIVDGYAIEVEKDAGVKSGFTDAQFAAAGCTVADRASVVKNNQMIFSVNPPPAADLALMKGKTAISWVGRRLPDAEPTLKASLESGVQLMDLTAVPRITIGQKLDVL